MPNKGVAMKNVTILAMFNTMASTVNGPMDIFYQAGVLWNAPARSLIFITASGLVGLVLGDTALFGATKLILFMNLFFGGATGLIEMMIKVWAIYMVAVAVGVSFSRFRVDQSIRFFLKVPTLIGIAAVIFVQYSFPS